MTSEHHTDAKREIGHLAWPLLGLVTVALITIVILEVESRDDPMPMVEPNTVSLPIAQPVILVAPQASNNSSQWAERTLARPLFSETRRPPADTPVVTTGPVKLPRLTGVVVSPAGSFAIFAGIEGGKPTVVREGDQVGDAVIEAVSAGQVTMRGLNGLAVLHPSFGEKALQVSRLSPVGPTRTGYRPRQGGHDAAVLNRLHQPAT